MSGFVIEEFTPVIKGASLRGFARVRLPSKMVMHDVAVHHRDGKSWVSPASKPMLGRDGQQMKSADGKLMWVPLTTFADRETRERFSVGVIEALRESHPQALA
jgi:hypothetical protein